MSATADRTGGARGGAADDDKPGENPFAQDVAAKLAEPTSLVIFGVTGDLAKRKLLPAVYNLAADGQLPERFRLVGMGRRGDLDSFRSEAREAVQEFSRTDLDDAAWEALGPELDYVTGDYGDPDTFKRLADSLKEGDERLGTPTRRLFYLSVGPNLFAPIAQRLAEVGLGAGSEPTTALIIEKPFGYDLASAEKLNADLDEAFGEERIFRIDHYLGKETVQNLLVLRFANGIFEPVWNRRYVDHIEITVAEELGVGSRAGYYDSSGALRDIIQNHALQLLSLVCMEPPTSFTAGPVRDEKVKVLRAVRPIPREQVAESAVRGQYADGWVGGEPVRAYREEDNVPDDSRTDTYAALRLEIDNWRWAGTPIYIRTGKRLPLRTTQIAVQFKPAPHMAFGGATADGGAVPPNELLLSVQPNEGATLRMAAKVPGSTMDVRPVQMNFEYGATFLRESPEAYERLLHDAMVDEKTLFTRSDEVEAAWRIVDPILEAWEADEAPLEFYESGVAGPAAAWALIEQDGRGWRPLLGR